MKLSTLIPGLLAWIALALVIGKLLKLHGADYWILVAGLAFLGLLAAAALWWFTREKNTPAARQAEPSSGEPVHDLERIFREAESRLAHSQLGANAKLSTLPVFFVLGERAATKTSVVLQSGMELELLAGEVHRDGAVIPTKALNLWFAQNNVLLEAAAAVWQDAKSWASLVDRLRPGRLMTVRETRQAPRAALICFDCEAFFRPNGAQAAIGAARTMHDRLSEMSQRLGVSFPVYVLFTRMDRVAFFHDFVANLKEEEASHVFGVTLPSAVRDPKRVYTEEETARLNAAFDNLYLSLAEKRPDLLLREHDAAKLPGAYQFPREFNKMRSPLVQFLVELARPSQLNSSPFLRGFYFTGVRPVVVNQSVAAPVPVVPAEEKAGSFDATSMFMAGQRKPAASGAGRQTPEIVQRRVPQWTFLPRLFTGVLLADHDALGASGTSSQTGRSRRILLGIAAAACLVLSAGLVVSYLNNRALEAQVQSAVEGISPADTTGTDFASLDSLTRLERLRQSLQELTDYRANGAPLRFGWGLYTGNALLDPTRILYFQKFHQILFARTESNLLRTLSDLPLSPRRTDDYQSAYDTLKSYLMTTSDHDRSTQTYLAPILTNRWLAGQTIDAQRLALARKQFDFYSQQLKASNPFSSENDAAAVEHARRYLGQFAGAERVYQFMLAEAAKGNPPINFNARFPGSAAVVVDSYDVSGAFTKAGFQTMGDALKHIDRFFNGEEWVLGKQTSANLDLTKLQQEIQSRYVADLTNAWRTYLKRAAVLPYKSLRDAAQKLAILSGPESPLLELFSLASQNTHVDSPLVTSAFKALYTVMPPTATDQYIVPANDGYMKALAALQVSLEQVAEQPGAPSDSAAAQTLSNAQNAKLAARQMAQSFGVDSSAHLEATIEKLMEDPITSTEVLLRGLGPAELNGKGKEFCSQLSPILLKFPFNSRAKDQATVSDLNSIFKPKDGALWTFYSASLSKYLVRQGSQYVPDPTAPVQLTSAFVAFFNRAASFSDLLYGNGSSDPQFSFDVKPLLSNDIDSLKLTIDGQSSDFAQSSPAKTFPWTGSGIHNVQLTGKYRGGTDFQYPAYDGLWAVFEWVDDADLAQGSTFEWKLKAGSRDRPVLSPVTNQPVAVQFTISNPVFQKNYFNGLGCVAQIAKP